MNQSAYSGRTRARDIRFTGIYVRADNKLPEISRRFRGERDLAGHLHAISCSFAKLHCRCSLKKHKIERRNGVICAQLSERALAAFELFITPNHRSAVFSVAVNPYFRRLNGEKQTRHAGTFREHRADSPFVTFRRLHGRYVVSPGRWVPLRGRALSFAPPLMSLFGNKRNRTLSCRRWICGIGICYGNDLECLGMPLDQAPR